MTRPVLNIALGSARKRVVGDTWAWAARSAATSRPFVAVTLARYGLVKTGNASPQIL